MRPIILISKCLGFEKCRYTGQMIPDKIIMHITKYIEPITICPEVEIGLTIPRGQLSIIKNKLIDKETYKDLTNEMLEFSKRYISNLKDIDGAILMARSPSCSIYSAKRHIKLNQRHTNGSGIFGEELMKQFPDLPKEEKGRLDNYEIRTNFLTKIFLIRRFKNKKSLKDFQKNNKFLLMSFNRNLMKQLGQLASEENEEEYEKIFYKILKKDQTTELLTDVFTHIYGFMKDKTTKEEKKYILDLINKFKENKIPKTEILGILKELAIRFDEKYILNQTIFSPYPEGLELISDSGKGIDF